MPWSKIPPLKLSQELPDFEVGQYTDILDTIEKVNEMNKIASQRKDPRPHGVFCT